jgi:Integrase core domain
MAGPLTDQPECPGAGDGLGAVAAPSLPRMWPTCFLTVSTTTTSSSAISGFDLLTDNGPEFTGKAFTSHLEHLGVRQHRIPPRSPNHNAVCERFQGTALQEFYRPAFHRQHFARLADLNAQFQGWLQHYNTRRRNHGDFMRGRTPFAVMEARLA